MRDTSLSKVWFRRVPHGLGPKVCLLHKNRSGDRPNAIPEITSLVTSPCLRSTVWMRRRCVCGPGPDARGEVPVHQEWVSSWHSGQYLLFVGVPQAAPGLFALTFCFISV